MYTYEKDAYQTQLETNVLSCTESKQGYQVILEDTIFFPEGGGQPCDLGTINGVNVIDVQIVDGQVIHTTKAHVEGKVHCELDWNRRFDHMQAHSGEHIFVGLAHRKYGVESVGFHMGDVITVDFDRYVSEENIFELEKEANDFVFSNRKFHVLYPTQEELSTITYRSKKEIKEQIRIVEIEDCDVCACCGTHVKSSAEVGLIKVLSSQKYKGGVRIELLFGRKAMHYFDALHIQATQISQRLKKPIDTLSESVDNVMTKSKEKDGTVARLFHQYMDVRFKQISPRYFQLVVEDELTSAQVKQMCDGLLERSLGIVCMVVSQGYYVIESKDVDLTTLKQKVQDKLQSRGGGNSSILQGKTPLDHREILEVLANGI